MQRRPTQVQALLFLNQYVEKDRTASRRRRTRSTAPWSRWSTPTTAGWSPTSRPSELSRRPRETRTRSSLSRMPRVGEGSPREPQLGTVVETDLLIIGAGPTGLFAAYYAGFRGHARRGRRLAARARRPDHRDVPREADPRRRRLPVASRAATLVEGLVEQAATAEPEYLLDRTAREPGRGRRRRHRRPRRRHRGPRQGAC